MELPELRGGQPVVCGAATTVGATAAAGATAGPAATAKLFVTVIVLWVLAVIVAGQLMDGGATKFALSPDVFSVAVQTDPSTTVIGSDDAPLASDRSAEPASKPLKSHAT